MKNIKNLTLLVVCSVALIFGWWLLASMMETVENGNIGMVKSFGKIDDDTPLNPGLVWLNPFTEDLVQMNVQTIKWSGKTTAYTKDVQQADVVFVANYNLNPLTAPKVYREVGLDWSRKLIGQVVVEEIKREIGTHEAVPLVANRDQAARRIEESVRIALAKRNVNLTGFQLTDISYTRQFETAVEQKVVAQQKAIEEQNRTVQKKELANQQIVAAQGNAESMVLTAKAEAEAQILAAKASAESIKIRSIALQQNPDIIQWEAVKMWNGVLPTHMLSGAAVPFVNLQGK